MNQYVFIYFVDQTAAAIFGKHFSMLNVPQTIFLILVCAPSFIVEFISTHSNNEAPLCLVILVTAVIFVTFPGNKLH